MKIKILSLLLVCVSLVGAFTSCKDQTPLYKKGEDVVELMAEMVKSDEYLKLHGYADNDSYTKTLDAVRNGDYSDIAWIYELTIPVESLLAERGKTEELSDELLKYSIDNVYSSFASMLNTKAGLNSVVVSTVFYASITLVNKSAKENKIYIYVFDDGCPIAVSFVLGEDSTVKATGHFIIYESFMTDEPESVESSCADLGVIGVEAKKVWAR